MPVTGQSHRFTRAIAKLPSKSCVSGLRAEDRGAPDHALFQSQHAAYCHALKAAGVSVTLLDAEEPFPDSVFVEDTALCLPEGAVLLRPGAPSRAGEVYSMNHALRGAFDTVMELNEGSVDGGDILTTESEIILGLSERSTAEGGAALANLLAQWGHRLRIAETPEGVLHFKSDCAILDEETILATPRLAAVGVFQGYRVIETVEDEMAAANVIRVNDTVFLAEGYPRTADRLDKAGYALTILDISEAAKLDGGLSCMSLRFTIS